jgi:serine protease
VPSRSIGHTVIYVGGTTEHGCPGDYTNHGPGIDLVAPGGGGDGAGAGDLACPVDGPAGRNIPQVTFRRKNFGRFLVPADFQGTSMAAPQVSGAVALLLASRTLEANASPGQIADHLKATARDLGAPGRDAFYGDGLLDIAAALGAPPAPAAAPASAAPPAR